MGNRMLKIGALAGPFLLTAWILMTVDFIVYSQQDKKTMIEQGRRVFSGSCGMAYCHGSDAAGGGGPKLRDREFSAQYLNKVINDGVPGTGMPSFKSNLKKEQIAQVVAFLLSINKEVKSNSAQIDPNVAPAPGKPEKPSNDKISAEAMKPMAKGSDLSGPV